MIVAAVVCPHPPLLIRELCGAEDAVPELRDACRRAVASLLSCRPDVVAVVGGGEATRAWDPALPVGVRRFGTTVAAEDAPLPQSLGVGRRLLDEAGWVRPLRMQTVRRDAGPAELARVASGLVALQGRVGLLVLGDGSARRGVRAPGHLDERAFAFDDETARALDEGDAQALARVDPVLAEELLAQGRAALAVLGEVALAQGAPRRTEVVHREDPYGVDYVVAAWTWADE